MFRAEVPGAHKLIQIRFGSISFQLPPVRDIFDIETCEFGAQTGNLPRASSEPAHVPSC
jgi:hypothetical protein